MKQLTASHRAVLPLLAAGMQNKEIAKRLGRSPEAIKSRVAEILRRLQARNRTEAAAKAAKAGLI